TLQCGERGPRRLSELAAQDSNRGHALVLECGAQWALRGTLRARHGPLQSVAPDGGAFERSLLDVQLRDARPIPRSIPSGCPPAVWAPSRLTPWSTANRIAAEGSPSSLLRLSARKPEPSVTDFGDHRCRTRCSAGESVPG